MSTVTLYLRIPPELRAQLDQEAIARARAAGTWRRPNVQLLCVELLQDRLAHLAELRATPAKKRKVRK